MRPDELRRQHYRIVSPRTAGGPRVQALIAQSTDEALNKRILLSLARCDVVPVDISHLRPLQDRLACELGAVVGNAALGWSATTCD